MFMFGRVFDLCLAGVTKMLVVCSTVTKMFGRVFDHSLAVGRVFDCY